MVVVMAVGVSSFLFVVSAVGVGVLTVRAVAVLVGQARFLFVGPLGPPTPHGLAVYLEVAFFVALVTLGVSSAPFASSLRLGGKDFI